jgi:hypothetical protein
VEEEDEKKEENSQSEVGAVEEDKLRTIMVSVTGYDTTYGGTVHAAHQYFAPRIKYHMHFKEQVFYCPETKTNFVDMGVFDELEPDVLWLDKHCLLVAFHALKNNWTQAKLSKSNNIDDIV